MKIEAVDFFYVSMPVVTTEATQPGCAARARSFGGHEGWGECEAHRCRQSLRSSAQCRTACAGRSVFILGQTLNGPDDIARISRQVAYDSMDLLQAAHTMSGVEMAMWDLLAACARTGLKLLGYTRSAPKVPYASRLFATLRRKPSP